MMQRSVVFVLGMHRSGTSLVSELVHAMGYEVPGTMLDTVEQINARGFWESQQVVDLDERLLASTGAAWYQVGYSLPPASARSPGFESVSADIRAFLAEAFDQHERLVIKDPRLCHLLPVWLRQIDRRRVRVKIVWIERSPLAVARSLQKRDGFSPLTGLLLWLDSFFAGMKTAAGLPCLLLDFNRLLVDQASCEILSQFVGSPLPRQSWSSIVDSGLAHHAPEEVESSPTAQLARECHASIEHGTQVTPAFLRRVGQLRRRYGRLQGGRSEFFTSLAATNASLVKAKQTGMQVGALHAKALEVIAEQRRQIAEWFSAGHPATQLQQLIADRDRAIERYSVLVSKGESRIGELEQALATRASELQAASSRIQDLDAFLAVREEDIARNSAYIETCHRRIQELHSAMSEFETLRSRLADVESALAARKADIEHNAQYIAACHRRIAELDSAVAEFEALRGRLAEAEAALAHRDAGNPGQPGGVAACAQQTPEATEEGARASASGKPPAGGAAP